ncbi:MAG: hypothetical protein JXA99_08390 [Candidatus Lokiarchaeota archaeon]|nr:hypothetical protein [Candidatus Lokiarchaeota archaeon]
MKNLKALNVPYLDKLAKECNIKVKGKKDIKIKQILDAKIPEKKLETLFQKYLTEQKEKKKSPNTNSARLKNIENQIQFIMSKISQLETMILEHQGNNQQLSFIRLDTLKKRIKQEISPKEMMSVDDLLNVIKQTEYSKKDIETAVIELIDEEVLDFSEGASKEKLDGKIGLLIRR